MSEASLGTRAVVIGSGIAGLLSARLLSPLFDEVILIDRDRMPETPSARVWLPQGNHFHALLRRQQAGHELANHGRVVDHQHVDGTVVAGFRWRLHFVAPAWA